MKYEISQDEGVWTVTRGSEPVGRYVTKAEAHKSADVFNAWADAERVLSLRPSIDRR